MTPQEATIIAENDFTFSQLKREVIDAGLCTHCGLCAGLSGGAVAMRPAEEGPLPHAAGEVGLPSVVGEVCPGYGADYPALNRHLFGTLPVNWLIGHVRQAYVGYSAVEDVRRAGASGGVITQTLLYLLEAGLVDGAVVVRQGTPQPWLAEPIIATTPEQIRACAQSVYQPVPVNAILGEVERFDGRLAYVGLPDQVAALRGLQQRGYAQNVDYVLGPYTGTNMYLASIESYLRSNGYDSLACIAELRYREGEWPGYLQIKTTDGSVLRAEKFYYNYLIPFYITRHTLLAVDFANELTDIAVGDAWNPRYEAQRQGFSVVVARSERGQTVLEAMHEAGLVALEAVSLDEAMSMHGHMMDFKKRGAFIRMGWRARGGRAVPDYGYTPTELPASRRLVEAIISGLFAICGTRLARRAVEHVPLGLIGPLFNTLRKSWKNVSKPIKRKGLGEYEVTITS